MCEEVSNAAKAGSPVEDLELPDDVVAVQDEGALTGAAAREARKQRKEERDSARLQRMNQSVAARRAKDAQKSKKQTLEEERLQRVAQKAAARRASRGSEGGGDAPQAEEGGSKDQAEAVTTGANAEKSPAAEAQTVRVRTREERAAERREKRAARGQEPDGAKAKERERTGSQEARRQHKHRKPSGADGNAEQGEKAPAQQEARRQHKHRKTDGAEGTTEQRGSAVEGEKAPAQRQRRHRERPSESAAPAKDSATATAKAAATTGAGSGAPGATSGSDSSDDDSSSSSSSSSSSPSSPSAHAMAIAKAMATGAPLPISAPSKAPCFAWERSLVPSTMTGLPTPQSAVINGAPVIMPLASSTELEEFLRLGSVDGEAAVRLRQLPPQLQRIVMDRGPVAGTRNPSSVIISRIKEVEALRLGQLPGAGLLGLGPGAGARGPAAVGGLGGLGGGGGPSGPPIPEIEGMISRYNLDPQASAMLRRLSPQQQQLAAKLPVHEARNPSAYVMTQLSMPRLLGTGEAARLPTQPHDPTAMMISGMLRR